MWRSPVVVSSPAGSPLSVEDAKRHLHVDHSDDDDLIENQIAAAVAHVEALTGTALIDRGLTLRCDVWSDLAALPVAPVSAVAAISYTDTSGAAQTLATEVYSVRLEGLDPAIALRHAKTWPAIEPGSLIEVEATAGYGVAAPPALVQALKLIVADFYAFRETAQIGSVAGQIPSTTTVDALLANYRKHLI